MFSEKRLFRLRKNATSLCIVLSVTIFSPPVLHCAEERSYGREIQQYVAEDKVYLLENIRQNITRPSEKTVVDALLCESGPQAIELFKKQLREYPDPELDQLSTARIAAYNLALESTALLPKLSRPLPLAKPNLTDRQDNPKQQLSFIPEKPNRETENPPNRNLVSPPAQVPEKSKQDAGIRGKNGFTLQFGSFTSKENADALADKISVYEATKTIQDGELFKVRLKKNYASRKEATDIEKELPFSAIVIQENEGPH
jgi:cell division septation protein DedD